MSWGGLQLLRSTLANDIDLIFALPIDRPPSKLSTNAWLFDPLEPRMIGLMALPCRRKGTARRLSPARAGQERRRALAHHDRPWTLVHAPGAPVRTSAPAVERAGDAEPVVVVPVSGRVPVAVRRAEVPRFVVPRPAAKNAPAGGRSGPRDGSNHPSRKIAWRRRQVSACSAWAIHARTRRSISSVVTPRVRQRARRPRNRLRKRRTLSSGSLRHPPARRTKPRNVAGSLVGTIDVLLGCRRRRRSLRNPARLRCQSSSCSGSSWNRTKSST